MGRAARTLADLVVVTSDNPRSEDPDAIIAEITEGTERARGGGDGRPPRRHRARGGAGQEGDVVVIAGKGHEQGQEFAGGRKIPFDDVTVAREALA